MTRSIIQVYALAVCFATLMCLVIALGFAGYDLVRVAAPGFTIQEYMLWQNDEHFLTYYPDKKSLPPAERAALRATYRQSALQSERRSAAQRLVFVSIILTIDLIIYFLHWRLATRSAPAMP